MRNRMPLPACAFALLILLMGCSSSKVDTASVANPAQPSPIAVVIAGSSASTIEAGSSLTFTAAVSNDASASGVAWSLSGPGSLSNSSATQVTYVTPSSVSTSTAATITATSVKDATKSSSTTFAITPGVIFAAQMLPTGHVSTAYSAALIASGGTGTCHFSVASGTLPAGLTLSATGVLSGTPTGVFNGSITVQIVDDATPRSIATQTLALRVAANIAISNAASLPTGTVGQSYSFPLLTTGQSGSVTWAVTSGTPPAGLTLSNAGILSGTPTVAFNGNLTVQATDDATLASATQTAALKISSNIAIANAASPPIGAAGQAYSFSLLTTRQSGSVTWAVTGGTLPAGLTLSTAGVLSGTPTAANTGGAAASVTVTDDSGGSATAALAVKIIDTRTVWRDGMGAEDGDQYTQGIEAANWDPIQRAGILKRIAYHCKAPGEIFFYFRKPSTTTAGNWDLATPTFADSCAAGATGLRTIDFDPVASPVNVEKGWRLYTYTKSGAVAFRNYSDQRTTGPITFMTSNSADAIGLSIVPGAAAFGGMYMFSEVYPQDGAPGNRPFRCGPYPCLRYRLQPGPSYRHTAVGFFQPVAGKRRGHCSRNRRQRNADQLWCAVRS